jgi:hypothetical protein
MHQRARSRAPLYTSSPPLGAPAALLLTLLGLLAGCGQATPNSLPSEGNQPDATPIAPSGWTTYRNTAHNYTMRYPANWFVSDTAPSADSLKIYNFDPTKVEAEDIPPLPFNKYDIDAYVNPNRLSLPDFFALYRQTDADSPPASSQSLRSPTVAGRAALEVIQQPVQWSGGSIDYPSVTYFVSDGDSMLIVSELYSTGGQPSPVFAYMIGSLKIGK